MISLTFYITLFSSFICTTFIFFNGFNYFNAFILSYMFSSAIIIIFAVFLYFITKNKKIRIISSVKKDKNILYYREPPFSYSPVIITYLENLKLEINKDCFAELLFLSKKKYIQIQKFDNKYIIIKNTELCNNFDKLLQSQQFILSNINNKMDLNTFIAIMKKNKKKLEAFYEQDCYNLGYLKRFKDIFRNDKLMSFLVYLLIIFIGLITLFSELPSDILSDSIFFGIFAKFFVITLFNLWPSIGIAFLINTIFNRIILLRTNKAKEDYSKWIAFRDFLNDYTLIKNYNLESINLLEDYLTYSVALGITKISIE